MPSLRGIRDSVRTRFKRIGPGDHFMGLIRDIPDTTRVTNMLSARRLLQVNPKASAEIGDEIESPTGDRWLCGDHGTGYYAGQDFYRVFKMFEVHKHLEWARYSDAVDPVTGLVRNGVKTVLTTTLPVSEEPISEARDDFRIPLGRKFYVTNQPIEVGDLIGDYKVTKVDTEIGLYSVELE